MTPTERAEYIVKWIKLGPLRIDPQEVSFVAAQIEEAERDMREAVVQQGTDQFIVGFAAARKGAREIALHSQYVEEGKKIADRIAAMIPEGK